MTVLTLYARIFVAAAKKAGGNMINFMPKWYRNYTAPPDLNKHSQLLHSAYVLQHIPVPAKVPSRHGHSKMDSCQKKMALHLQLHLYWLRACMNQKAKTVARDTRISHSSNISSPSTLHRGLLLSSPTAVLVKKKKSRWSPWICSTEHFLEQCTVIRSSG